MCGNEDVKLKPLGDDFVIECDIFGDAKGCGLSTGYYKSKKDLINDWNNMNTEG